jgi:serine/threonine protein kinase
MDWPSASAATPPAGAIPVERSDRVLVHLNDDNIDLESLQRLSPAEIIGTFTTAYKIPSSFTSFVLLSVFALANTFSMNHYFRKNVNHANELWLSTGASFRVSVYRRQNHAWVSTPSLPTSQTLVSKMPILRRPGEPYDEKRLAMIILELRLLIHPPLANHENIVSLQGIAWQHSLDAPGVVVPCLLLEFAEYGTLADLLRGEGDIPFKTKLHLLYDIALGLEALHKCGIAQGDVKPDNVLIFKHPTRRFIAKLADFGYSFLEVEEDVYVGGTMAWKAPETIGKPVPRDLVPSTDLYSYGLLIWQVMLGKQSVFDYLCTGSRASSFDDLKLVKEKDLVLRKAVDWAHHLDPDHSDFVIRLFKATLTRDPKKRSLEDILRTFWGDDEHLQLERAMLTLFPVYSRRSIREQTVSL